MLLSDTSVPVIGKPTEANFLSLRSACAARVVTRGPARVNPYVSRKAPSQGRAAKQLERDRPIEHRRLLSEAEASVHQLPTIAAAVAQEKV